MRKLFTFLFIFCVSVSSAVYSAETVKNVENKETDVNIFKAAEQGDVAVLKEYLDKGGDPNARPPIEYQTDTSGTLLHLVASNHSKGAKEAAELLLSHGANIEALTNVESSMTPLGVAAWSRNLPIVKILIDHGANIHASRPSGWHMYSEEALGWAALNGDLEMTKYLLSKGAKFKTDPDGKGELNFLNDAIKSGNIELLEYLISQGLDVKIKPKGEYSNFYIEPVFTAIHLQKPEMLDVLIKHGADITLMQSPGTLYEHENIGLTPLQIVDKKLEIYTKMKNSLEKQGIKPKK